jgi:hypothetical protein
MSYEFEATDDLEFGAATCAGCDEITSVDDIGLCRECAAKLDRDLIRERSWEHSISAFFLKPDERELLRERVVREHGGALELIAPSGVPERRVANGSSGGPRAIESREGRCPARPGR